MAKKVKKVTMHDVFDTIAEFEASVKASDHPLKSLIIKFASANKASWKAFCRQMSELGPCKGSKDFCEPKP